MTDRSASCLAFIACINACHVLHSSPRAMHVMSCIHRVHQCMSHACLAFIASIVNASMHQPKCVMSCIHRLHQCINLPCLTYESCLTYERGMSRIQVRHVTQNISHINESRRAYVAGRYLLNRLLSRHKEVWVLDADVGQAEFTPGVL